MFDKSRLNTILLGGVIILLILVLARDSPDSVLARGESGAGGGGDGARHIFGLVGSKEGNREPLYLIDTKHEVIMVYEYGVQSEGFGLTEVRSYKYDKLLKQYGKGLIGPKVDKVKEAVEKSKK